MVDAARVPGGGPSIGGEGGKKRPILILGELEFSDWDMPQRFRHTEEETYSEHARIEGKPRLQWTGTKLKGVSLRFRLHSGWCDPDAMLQQLQKAKTAKKPMPLTIGSQVFKGSYVLESIDSDVDQVDLDGKVIQMDVSVSLIEDITPIEAEPPSTSPFLKRVI